MNSTSTSVCLNFYNPDFNRVEFEAVKNVVVSIRLTLTPTLKEGIYET